MKFLLNHQVNIESSDMGIKVYPGTPGLIKLANSSPFFNYEKIEKQEGDYLVTDYYLFNSKEFYWLNLIYENQINLKRKKFWKQDPIIQLVKILRYIFERNNRAKQVSKFYAEMNAYHDKNLFLDIALNIAKKVKFPFFSYGYQEDPFKNYYRYIYYFEIQDLGQVSFHSEILFDNVDEFSGEWIGIRNEKFPFNLRDVKKLTKGGSK